MEMRILLCYPRTFQAKKFLDEQGRILNVIPPNPETTNVESVTELPELNIESETGFGAILKAQLTPRPEYQGEIKQVIDCITPRDGIVGFVNGEPYYGAFHVMPNGIKMTGAKHSDSDFIIYDTPQESRTSRGMMASMSSLTTVSSPDIEENVSNTTTTSQPDTSNLTTAPQMDIPDQTPTQQPSQQTYTPPPSSPPSGGGSSGSGGGSSGGGGYGGGY